MFLTKSVNFQIDKDLLKKQAELNTDDGIFHISGYASVFGNVDSYGDIVERGAFQNSIAQFLSGQKKIKVLLNHKIDNFAGLAYELEEREQGLYCDLGIAKDLSVSKELIKGVELGILDEFSIGYTLKNYWIDEQDNWHLTDIDLKEISIVTFAANDKAKIQDWKMRQLDLNQDNLKFSKMKQQLDEYQSELQKIKGLIK